MSFLDLYQGDQDRAARIQPTEGHDLPSDFDANFNAAWSNGLLFSQSTARETARAGVLNDYVSEIRQKTGQDISQSLNPDAESGTIGPGMFEQANARVAKMKADYPDLDLAPLDDAEIDKRALAKAQAAHRNYQALQAGEKTAGGSFGSFLGSAGAGVTDPINIIGLPIAPEAAGIGILSTALRWGALAGVSQAAIEFASDDFKEQVQPGYAESGEPIKEIGGAFLGGAVVGGTIKALGNAWTRVKSGQWPTSVRDAGNVIESEANIQATNPFVAPKPVMSDAEIAAAVSGQPTAEAQERMLIALRLERETTLRAQQDEITAGMSMQPISVETEIAHREAMVKSTDDILAGRPVDVSAQITPEIQRAAADADRARARAAAGQSMPTEQLPLPLSPETEAMAPKRVTEPGPQPVLQTAEDMSKTLTAPDHQDAIRADIDRERAMGDVQVPGIDENGNHTMVSVDKAMDQVDAYKAAAEQIQACANPPAEEGQAA